MSGRAAAGVARRQRAGRVRLTAVLVIVLSVGCGRAELPSVLLVSIDTLRADIAEQGMPGLARLAERGTRFTRASSNTPLTLPSHATLLTGCRPARHGLTVNGLAVPEFPVPTLAEVLAARGYQAGAFVSASVLDERHGLGRGFAHYDDTMATPDGPANPHERRGDHTVDRALAWVVDQPGPWFAFVHLYDPHAPYAAPDGRSEPRAEAYRDEVAFADRQLGRLLDALEGQDVLVVVTSDHGEGLGEHGEQTHGLLLHEATLHVPLVMGWWGAPERPRPGGEAVRADVVSLLDVSPTLLELLGVSDPTRERDGRSVVRAGAPRAIPLEARAGWFYYGFSPLAGVRLGERKLVGAPLATSPRWELFGLDDDPGEHAPRSGADDPLVALVPDTESLRPGRVAVDEASLRALGYMGADSPPPRVGGRSDPRDAMALIDAIDAANTALVANDARAALAALEPYRAAWSDVAELQLFVGKAQRSLGRFVQADQALRRAVELQPSSLGALHEHAKLIMERAGAEGGDAAEAVSLLEHAEQLVPGDRETVALRALHDVVFGSPQAALERLAPALARWPDAAVLRTVEARARQALASGRR